MAFFSQRLQLQLQGHQFQDVCEVVEWLLTIPHAIPRIQFQWCFLQWNKFWNEWMNLAGLSVILGFYHEVDESCTLLDYYTVSSGNSLLTFWDNLLVPSSSISNYYYSVCNIPEECGSHLGMNTLIGVTIYSNKVMYLYHFWLLGTFGYALVSILGWKVCIYNGEIKSH